MYTLAVMDDTTKELLMWATSPFPIDSFAYTDGVSGLTKVMDAPAGEPGEHCWIGKHWDRTLSMAGDKVIHLDDANGELSLGDAHYAIALSWLADILTVTTAQAHAWIKITDTVSGITTIQKFDAGDNSFVVAPGAHLSLVTVKNFVPIGLSINP